MKKLISKKMRVTAEEDIFNKLDEILLNSEVNTYSKLFPLLIQSYYEKTPIPNIKNFKKFLYPKNKNI